MSGKLFYISNILKNIVFYTGYFIFPQMHKNSLLITLSNSIVTFFKTIKIFKIYSLKLLKQDFTKLKI